MHVNEAWRPDPDRRVDRFGAPVAHRRSNETLAWADNYLRGVEPATHERRTGRVVSFAEDAEVREFVVDTPHGQQQRGVSAALVRE